MTTLEESLFDLQDQLARNKMSEEQVIKTIHHISNYYKTAEVEKKLKELGITKSEKFLDKFVEKEFEYDDIFYHTPYTRFVDHVISKYTPEEMIEKSDYFDINIEDYKE